MSTMKSGLRASFVVNRAETAQNVARDIVSSHQYQEYHVTAPVFTHRAPSVLALPRITDPEMARYAFVAIFHGPGKRNPEPVGVIEVPALGMARIHVLKEHESLGRAIAIAFKQHGAYPSMPKVSVHSRSVPERYDSRPSKWLAHNSQQVESASNKIKEERRILRLK